MEAAFLAYGLWGLLIFVCLVYLSHLGIDFDNDTLGLLHIASIIPGLNFAVAIILLIRTLDEILTNYL